MTLFRVRQQQWVTYSWYVDADTEHEAELSDRNGVPDEADSKLHSSDTEATPVTASQRPEELDCIVVLPRWAVTYQVLAGVSGGQVAADGVVTVGAIDAEVAAELAETWIIDNDARHDSRIEPSIVIVSAEDAEG
jgi:hypothetical protein